MCLFTCRLLFLGVFLALQKVSSLNGEIISSKKFFISNDFFIACVHTLWLFAVIELCHLHLLNACKKYFCKKADIQFVLFPWYLILSLCQSGQTMQMQCPSNMQEQVLLKQTSLGM